MGFGVTWGDRAVFMTHDKVEGKYRTIRLNANSKAESRYKVAERIAGTDVYMSPEHDAGYRSLLGMGYKPSEVTAQEDAGGFFHALGAVARHFGGTYPTEDR